MKTIWKYSLNPADYTDITMPLGARVLTAQVQDGVICIWAEVDPNASPETTHRFTLCATGQQIATYPGDYVGTVQLSGGRFVFHVYDRIMS